MSPVLTRHAPEHVRRLRDVAVPVVALLCFAVLFAGVLRLVEPSETVDTITVENRSGFDVEIGVTDGARSGVLPLTAIVPHATTRVDDVLDQGSTWVFRVSRAGDPVGTFTRSRDRLRAGGWRVVVPAAWDERLATADAQGTARP